ncbi:hypothetical protein J2R76_000191 [Bradyrhizobium sp. USDA 4532]|uniref:hypothetical protein n=1 Tax=unclassified Bradyrhizobium TaxID=2631580 RepID=UPI0020A02807|nr:MULTISPECIES: hypothetical protein [unclassified Bradyrhizobium]MCP1831764.1 hypothetical protein [Bradyrhizobium sp. USDA 4545]MCP1916600.1 hypothetical protein [Bradyrhizobium sp. USDA 4532]
MCVQAGLLVRSNRDWCHGVYRWRYKRQRLRVDVRIHPDASSVAKVNFDQSSTRGRYGAHPAVTRRQKLRSFLHLPSDDLHRRKRWYNLL